MIDGGREIATYYSPFLKWQQMKGNAPGCQSADALKDAAFVVWAIEHPKSPELILQILISPCGIFLSPPRSAVLEGNLLWYTHPASAVVHMIDNGTLLFCL